MAGMTRDAINKERAAKKKGAKKSKGFTAEFVVDKDTKNTRKFTEVTNGEAGSEKIGTLYIQKSAFGDSLPDRITVTVA